MDKAVRTGLALLAALVVLCSCAAEAHTAAFETRLAEGGAGLLDGARRLGERVASEARAPRGPAGRLSRGVLRADVRWSVDPGTGEDVLRGRISFMPGPECPACRSLRMVQAARVEKSPGRDYDWPMGQELRNSIRTRRDPARGVTEGTFVDHDAAKCRKGSPCSPYFRDSWPNADESADGSSAPGAPAEASLVDYPFGWAQFEKISLETCARCADTGEFLGCAVWGAAWPPVGERTLRAPRYAERPSATFMDALRRFEAVYAKAR